MTATLDSRIEVSRLTTLPEIDALQEEWRQLEERCPETTPFSTWEWCGAVARHYGGGRPSVDVHDSRRRRPHRHRSLRRERDSAGCACCGSSARPSAPTRWPTTRTSCSPKAAKTRRLPPSAKTSAGGAAGTSSISRSFLPRSSATRKLMEAAASRGWPVVLRLRQRRPPPRHQRQLGRLQGDALAFDPQRRRPADAQAHGGARGVLHQRRRRPRCRAQGDGRPLRSSHATLALDRQARHLPRSASKGLPPGGRAPVCRRQMLTLQVLRSGDETIAVKYGFQSDGTRYYYSGGFSPDPQWDHFRLGLVLDLALHQGRLRAGGALRRLHARRRPLQRPLPYGHAPEPGPPDLSEQAGPASVPPDACRARRHDAAATETGGAPRKALQGRIDGNDNRDGSPPDRRGGTARGRRLSGPACVRGRGYQAEAAAARPSRASLRRHRARTQRRDRHRAHAGQPDRDGLSALDLFDVHVIADNCDDHTAAIARELHARSSTNAPTGRRWGRDRLCAGSSTGFPRTPTTPSPSSTPTAWSRPTSSPR